MTDEQERCPCCGAHVAKYPELRDASWLAEQYANKRSHYEVAREVGCSPGTVIYAMKALGIARRRKGPQSPAKDVA